MEEVSGILYRVKGLRRAEPTSNLNPTSSHSKEVTSRGGRESKPQTKVNYSKVYWTKQRQFFFCFFFLQIQATRELQSFVEEPPSDRKQTNRNQTKVKKIHPDSCLELKSFGLAATSRKSGLNYRLCSMYILPCNLNTTYIRHSLHSWVLRTRSASQHRGQRAAVLAMGEERELKRRVQRCLNSYAQHCAGLRLLAGKGQPSLLYS